MLTFFIINDIREGGTWIEDYANDPVMLAETMRRLNGDALFETRFHIVAGPYAEQEANAKLAEINELMKGGEE